jgi:hypothetical protein
MLCRVISLEDSISKIVRSSDYGTDMLDDEHSTDGLPEDLAFVHIHRKQAHEACHHC